MGNFVQLLCSVVDLIGSTDGADSHFKSAILHEINDLVPRLLVWCHVEEWSHIFPYFQHKILMLMVKLSLSMQLGCSILILWLQLLHEHYQDLLSSPISQFACGQSDTLEGSPFLLSLDDQELCHLSSYHLQRRAIFLFLRCSLSLMSLAKTDDFQCTCERPSSFTVFDMNIVKECFAKKKGLLQFYEWLQVHFPSIVTENELKLDKCIKFASSFIKFYMQEDDMLFGVLLQMFTIPSWAEKLFSKEGRPCHVTEENILFHVSNLFNPLLLFHVFLAELQYDHQLLLDYLISKDMGGKCAEYLLRCLRIVCDSWELFLKYSGREFLVYQSICQRGCKKRRVSPDESSVGQIDTPLESGLAFEQNQLECNLGRCESLQFEDAKGCLLSLKSALRKLHRRKLFPYNPEVLMRRLSRFEELCDQLL
ncbi:uncharacterized protein LOC110682245 isoform X1 [Chenopodium quinoa]|uniref:uncharacterized protein LOC110682245 isoform X1 n=1 Tax=Chenopodium quinoa TaxID=63459 RepID=UPI000B776AD9|nr:uncharacterized protein LOC110682245 isoform X1 [Chenopodium quinoa]XP_021714221.1 uncharacterized protein LOC110682245 isoform X1 [Chenopodium quinoa]XP_021714222.1 uncharacterized protein LOC110682245 isoform X1 [Chenopodium quinoa]XP_021714223.1 uncharacterized protein LOC110682245 isoform X1 [Chenopodium quinoa]XP_021714224.1 uncharacterized protein LOC110682245 isoform X1 [Chenopodium quinoa]XP_021714225.1 uncharacterized protein LOC110682245 isoform X1 [Chenopodium quinoa]